MTNAALSSRNGIANSKKRNFAGFEDVNRDCSHYGVSLKRGNFRKTQEDRVSNHFAQWNDIIDDFFINHFLTDYV